MYLLANWNGNMFIRTEVLIIKWQSFPAQLILHKNSLMKRKFSIICVA